ncbi:MAG: hypothetical protein ACJ8BF_11570 [Gemmatimonadales bacterium]
MFKGLARGSTLLLAIVAGCGPAKSRTPVLEIVAAGDTLATPYSELTDAAWLGGNRWAALAPADNAVALVDFGSKSVRPLGGPKPKELRNPSSLFISGDTLYVGDWGLRRLTLWSLSGRLVRSIAAPSNLRGALPRSRDASARFYADLSPRPGPDGSGNRDSAAVIRTDTALTQADTIARLAPLDIAEVQGDAGRRFERRIFSGVDRWGVLPDGSLWVARVYDNRVDWRAPDGRWSRGQALPDRVLEVTRYDRELFLRKFPPELRRTAQDLPFAALKPPFEAGFTSAGGDVWLEKSRAPADSTRRYHIVNRQGRLIREIRLKGQGRILAVGAHSALVSEPTRQGVRLIRVELPQPQPVPEGKTE